MQVSGHIRKRGSKYQIIIELPRDNTTGKRKRKYKTINGTKKRAEYEMRKMMDEIECNKYVDKSNITVSEWMNKWIKLYLTDKSPTTIAGYKKQIKSYIIPQFGNLQLQSLTTIDVQEWVNSLYDCSSVSNKSLSAKSVKNIFWNLHSACHKAVILGILSVSPCDNIVLRNAESRVVNPYNEEEIKLFVDKVKGTDLELPMIIDLSLGLRRGELLALQWNDIDFKNQCVHISHNIVLDENRNIVVKEPKSKSGKRDISLSPNLLNILKQEHKKYLEYKLKSGTSFKDNNLVICQSDGSPYNPDSFSSKFRRFLKKNNLRPIRLHDIRHTNCTQLLMNGVDMKTMQVRLGHSDYNVTANTYSHVLPEVDKHASEVADSILFGNL